MTAFHHCSPYCATVSRRDSLRDQTARQKFRRNRLAVVFLFVVAIGILFKKSSTLWLTGRYNIIPMWLGRSDQLLKEQTMPRPMCRGF